MNAESLKRTIETKETWFWSRSRSSLWHKRNFRAHATVTDILVDCDCDSLTVLVSRKALPVTPASGPVFIKSFKMLKTSRRNRNETELGAVLDDLYELVVLRKQNRPKDSYTTYLFDRGLDDIGGHEETSKDDYCRQE
jgi:phosphoribosyl-ATP pyrophosphohydrolase/phosphoribosyl-AMP cyclohydrolase